MADLAEKRMGVCNWVSPLQLGVAGVATGGRVRASGSTERRFGVVLKALAELGLGVPGRVICFQPLASRYFHAPLYRLKRERSWSS